MFPLELCLMCFCLSFFCLVISAISSFSYCSTFFLCGCFFSYSLHLCKFLYVDLATFVGNVILCKYPKSFESVRGKHIYNDIRMTLTYGTVFPMIVHQRRIRKNLWTQKTFEKIVKYELYGKSNLNHVSLVIVTGIVLNVSCFTTFSDRFSTIVAKIFHIWVQLCNFLRTNSFVLNLLNYFVFIMLCISYSYSSTSCSKDVYFYFEKYFASTVFLSKNYHSKNVSVLPHLIFLLFDPSSLFSCFREYTFF